LTSVNWKIRGLRGPRWFGQGSISEAVKTGRRRGCGRQLGKRKTATKSPDWRKGDVIKGEDGPQCWAQGKSKVIWGDRKSRRSASLVPGNNRKRKADAPKKYFRVKTGFDHKDKRFSPSKSKKKLTKKKRAHKKKREHTKGGGEGPEKKRTHCLLNIFN